MRPPDRKTILHIIWSGGSGGAERFIRDITLYGDKSRFYHVVCFLGRGGWVADQMRQDGVEIVILGMKSGVSPSGFWPLVSLLRKCRPDIIHHHGRNYLVNATLCFFPWIPRIYFEHGGSVLSPDPGKEIFLYNTFWRHYRLVLVNSECVRQVILRLTKVPARLMEVFYIGIDTQRYLGSRVPGLRERLGIPEGHYVAGIVGRLVEMKGMDDFIRIAAAYKSCEAAPPCVFLIIGEGPRRLEWEALAQDLSAPVQFLGDRSDVTDLLTIMDVFVFTSRWEPFGIVLLEAMASGIPVVGFMTHGPAEIAAKGGAIAVEGRDVKRAADEVALLLKDPLRARALGEAGRRNVQVNFEVRGSIARLEKIYDRIGV